MALETFVDVDGTVYEATDFVTPVVEQAVDEFPNSEAEEEYTWVKAYFNGTASYMDLVNHFGSEAIVNKILDQFES